MSTSRENVLRATACNHGQQHVFRFWEQLTPDARGQLLDMLAQVDFALMDALITRWVLNEPVPEQYAHIVPVTTIPPVAVGDREAAQAVAAGEEALRNGKVAVFVVAGGQGTRLGFDGPKGSYPIGPITGKSLFAYHAEKIQHLQRRYNVELPWYIMVSQANEASTRAFFQDNSYFGLDPGNILFFTQRMVPCVDTDGKFILEAPHRLAMNPNGHGGSIQALVDGGAIDDAERRGIEIISYFQVDNWAVKVADPVFIGYHRLRNAAMSSKCHRRNDPREAVGAHCLCDGVYRVIEYTELEMYPQLLETDDEGNPVFHVGNPAIHLLSTGFVRSIYEHFDKFPWHKAHKKIPYMDDNGHRVCPDKPNGYKFETFVFDALRFTHHPPVALEIGRAGEYTPIKQYHGINSVVAARQSMADYWADWLEAAGCAVPRNAHGACTVPIEISPAFALTKEEFIAKTAGEAFDLSQGIAIEADGNRRHPPGRP